MSHETIHVILVDENNTPVGTMEKLEAHQKGVLHRAISVYIFDDQHNLLMQKRAASKYHCGGLWTNTCCGHPLPGEDSLSAATRRLSEEMGIACPLEQQFDFRYSTELSNGLVENEYGHIYFGKYNEAPLLNPIEADDFIYVSLPALQKQIDADPGKFTPWFKLVIPKVLQHLPAY